MEGMYVDNATIQNSTIKMYLDMTNQQIISTVHSKIMESFQNFSRQALKDFFWNPEIANPPIVIAEPVYGDIEPNFSEFMAPGMMVGITYIMAMGLSAMVVIIEKKEGLLDRSWFAGVRSWEVMFSMFLSLCITMLLQVALVLVLTFKVFNIPCKGPLFWVVVAVFLTGLEGMSYGLLISAIINDENIAMMVAMGSFYPSVLLSGIIWPVEAMPYYLRKISYCLPLTLIASSLRSLLSRGLSIMENGVYLGFLVCLAWIFPVLFIASLFFKYKK